MRHTTGTRKSPGEKIVKDVKGALRKQYSSEEKIKKLTIQKRRLQHQKAAA